MSYADCADDVLLPTMDYEALRARPCPARERLLPFLPAGSLTMIHGPGGCGKSWFALGLAAALATGRPFLDWTPSRAVGVLLIQGELEPDALRERVTALLPEAPPAPFELLHPEDLNPGEGELVDLAETWLQDRLVIHLRRRPAIKVLILDSLSALLPRTAETQRRPWEEKVLPTLAALRRLGIAVVMVHHSNRAGDPRGSRAREDALDAVIRLDPVAGAAAAGGPRLTVTLTKSRFAWGAELDPVEAAFGRDAEGRLGWRRAAAAAAAAPAPETVERLLELVRERKRGLTAREAGDLLGIGPAAVGQLKATLQAAGELAPGPRLVRAPGTGGEGEVDVVKVEVITGFTDPVGPTGTPGNPVIDIPLERYTKDWYEWKAGRWPRSDDADDDAAADELPPAEDPSPGGDAVPDDDDDIFAEPERVA